MIYKLRVFAFYFQVLQKVCVCVGVGGRVSQDGGGPQELSVAFHMPTIEGGGEQATHVRTGVPGSLLLSAQTQA